MTLLRHIQACNRFDPADYRSFAVGGRNIGLVQSRTLEFLKDRDLAKSLDGGVGIPDGGFLAVCAALARIVDALSGAKLMMSPRREMTPVLQRWTAPALAEIDRAGLPGLGLPAFGVHVNGYVRLRDGLHIWVGRRARNRLVAPGKLDHLVAGGIPSGLTAAETVIKEADEEAGLPPEIARQARPVGVVTYKLSLPEGLRNDTLFVYDLELPRDVTPASNDGEVDHFELWPIDRVIAVLRETDEFKFNVNLVLIDFLIRHGLLDPDHEPDYAALVQGLRR